jgi:hypothetical protein
MPFPLIYLIVNTLQIMGFKCPDLDAFFLFKIERSCSFLDKIRTV